MFPSLGIIAILLDIAHPYPHPAQPLLPLKSHPISQKYYGALKLRGGYV